MNVCSRTEKSVAVSSKPCSIGQRAAPFSIIPLPDASKSLPLPKLPLLTDTLPAAPSPDGGAGFESGIEPACRARVTDDGLPVICAGYATSLVAGSTCTSLLVVLHDEVAPLIDPID